jgi:hypothetical protein
MPWTAAAWRRIVRMNEKSIASVAGPAPCAARFRPNSINLSRVKSLRCARPREVLSALSTIDFDRRTGFPTWARSSRCSAIKSEKMRGCSWDLERRIGVPRSMERSASIAHSSASRRRTNVFATYWRFLLTWTRQLPEPSLVKVGIVCALQPDFVCATCAPRDQTRYKRVQFWLVWSAHRAHTFLI